MDQSGPKGEKDMVVVFTAEREARDRRIEDLLCRHQSEIEREREWERETERQRDIENKYEKRQLELDVKSKETRKKYEKINMFDNSKYDGEGMVRVITENENQELTLHCEGGPFKIKLRKGMQLLRYSYGFSVEVDLGSVILVPAEPSPPSLIVSWAKVQKCARIIPRYGDAGTCVVLGNETVPSLFLAAAVKCSEMLYPMQPFPPFNVPVHYHRVVLKPDTLSPVKEDPNVSHHEESSRIKKLCNQKTCRQ